jgi:hypothetical protein
VTTDVDDLVAAESAVPIVSSFIALETPQVRPLPPPAGLLESVCIALASPRAPPVGSAGVLDA